MNQSPHLWFTDELQFLRDTISRMDKCESDEEDVPPQPVFSQLTRNNFEILQEATNDLETKNFRSCIQKCSDVLGNNPGNAKAFRIRSRAFYSESKYEDAYIDMCEAQKLDYDENYSFLHEEMKKKKDEMTKPYEHAVENDSFPNIDTLMNDPHMMQLANQMMSDPSMMQNMQELIQNMKMR